MKTAILQSLLTLFTFSLLAQDNPASLFQTVDVAVYQDASFRMEGQLFIEDKAKNAGAIAFAFTSNGGKFLKSFFDKHSTDTFKPNVWNRISISGKIQKADKISVGAMFSGKGKYYFDDFRLVIIKSGGEVEVPLANNDFESESFSPWYVSNFKDQSKIKVTTGKSNSGGKSLLIDNSIMESESYGNNTKVGKYADINGVRLYYEVYGSGEPLLLIHGNNESIAAFDKQIPELSKSYMVIALDSRGQGNSGSDSTQLTYELFGDDVNKFLDYLNIKQANILGWSDGGNIALILAIQHPDKIKRLATMAAVLFNNSTSVSNKVNAVLNRQLAELEQQNISKNDMHYRLKKLLLTEPNINPDSLTRIHVPALIMAGENDIVKVQHTRLIAKKITNSTLKIFKNSGHEAPRDIPGEFNKTVLEFFNRTR